MNRSILWAAAVLLCAACAPKAPEKYLPDGAITAGENTRVETTYGTIEGYLDGTIYTFKGIRYAKAERFMPPQAPDRWEGVRQCKLYGPQTPQTETQSSYLSPHKPLSLTGNAKTENAFLPK